MTRGTSSPTLGKTRGTRWTPASTRPGARGEQGKNASLLWKDEEPLSRDDHRWSTMHSPYCYFQQNCLYF
jgi:hypothetical protein